MDRFLAALILAVASAAASAAPARQGDALDSPECAEARAELDSLLADPATREKTHAAALARARKQAALACLGRAGDDRERSGSPYPATGVAPPAIAPSPARATPPALPPPQPALVIPRPTAITACDAAGCWDSEGRRLNNIGPMLVGPRGPCIVQGAVATCP